MCACQPERRYRQRGRFASALCSYALRLSSPLYGKYAFSPIRVLYIRFNWTFVCCQAAGSFGRFGCCVRFLRLSIHAKLVCSMNENTNVVGTEHCDEWKELRWQTVWENTFVASQICHFKAYVTSLTWNWVSVWGTLHPLGSLAGAYASVRSRVSL